jgi:hypothetical protein
MSSVSCNPHEVLKVPPSIKDQIEDHMYRYGLLLGVGIISFSKGSTEMAVELEKSYEDDA